jgi:TPR repeat protein
MKKLVALVGLLLKYLQRRDGREITSLGFICKLVYLLTWNPDLSVGRRNIMQWNIMFRVFSNRLAKQAAKDGKRQFALGRCADAVVSFTRAISLGHLPSRATLACMLIEGREGVAQNIAEAVHLVESVSHLCHDCEGMSAMCLRIRYFTLPLPDKTNAMFLEMEKQCTAMAIRSARKASKYGLCELAYHTFKGDFTSRQVEEAHKLYHRAAQDGLDVALFHYGQLFYRRQNVPQDYRRALHLLRMAAAQGYIPAIQEIALFYERGRGVLKMPDLAREWRLRAQKAIVNSN